MIPPYCTIPASLKRGSKGEGVAHLQEHLTLNGHPLAIDADFGPATERALLTWRRRTFPHRHEAKQTGPTTDLDAARLTAPMAMAMAARGSIVDVARAYLEAGAREVGGNNRGPWVRLLCDGVEGRPWCGYAVRAWTRQAELPTASLISPSCDTTAHRAIAAGRLSRVPEVGAVYLVRKSEGDWVHMGVVTGVGEGWIEGVSGNSNDSGGREGIEVVEGVRGVSRLDFVRMSA